jgi:U3 small nucleolar RNA-associated protein 15
VLAIIANTRIDLYTPVLGQSPVIDEMLGKMQNRIERELGFERDLMKLRGALDMTLAQVCDGGVCTRHFLCVCEDRTSWCGGMDSS